MTEIDDYSEPLIQLQLLTKSLESAILHENNEVAMKLSNDILNAGVRLQNWCFRNMEI